MKKFIRSKNILSIILCLIIASAMFPTGVMTASAEAAKTYHVSSDTELDAAVAEINSMDSGTYDIYIDSDFTKNGGFSIDKAVTVNIFGENHTLRLTGQQSLQAWNGATLNLGASDYSKTLTIQGTGTDVGEEPGMLYVMGQSSVCNMYKGVTLKDRKSNNYLGGGVTVESGTFNMYGGTVDNCGIDGGSVCYGGGVAVFGGGVFNMFNGAITNCYVTSDYIDYYDPNICFTAMGGGVFVTGGSSFTMKNGLISNNTATNMGGGVALALSYGELRSSNFGYIKSKVTIDGGTISGNRAGKGAGVFASGYYYSFAGPIAAYGPGIGTQSDPGLYINGGNITRNSASDMGGGILIAMLRASVKAQIKNATIADNNAYTGAGIESYGYWTQTQIENCTLTGNSAEANGGAVSLSGNSSGGYTSIKDTVITDNTVTDTENNISNRGAGVYYDSDSQLKISGANIIKGNKYNGITNNLNILSKEKPVYVTGDLTGSEIGLSDPTLWADGKEDTDAGAVSTDYLTSGYKANNTIIPRDAFFSDHKSWYPDYSDVNENEVRLVRMTFDVNYHINNDDMSDIYADDIFTPYVTNHKVKEGNVIEEFHNIPKLKDPDGYIFKGWYYDRDNSDDSRPITFGETYQDESGDKYVKNVDIYAHWEPVEEVEKDPEDDKILPADMQNKYSSFGLFGVQIRPKDWRDKNIDKLKYQPGGLRFITSISENLLAELEKLQPDNKKLNDNTTNYEYGYVAAPRKYVDIYAAHYGRNTTNYELRYSGEDVNGENTTGSIKDVDHDYDYVTNVDCTSKPGRVDHKSFSQYRLSTFVVTYEKGDAAYKDREVCARAYLRYYDANGLLRTFYNDYGGTTTYGGCSVSYNEASGHINTENTDTYYKEGAN